jgi:AcrR family transcriptional regulator
MTDRRDDLLRRAYAYALEHGLADLSLRPLAAAIGSSPRVLLFLFGSKDGLVRELLAQARAAEMAMLADVRGGRLAEVAEAVWTWLAAPERRALLTLWLEGYSRSLVAPDGPWVEFARTTVEDWLAVLAETRADEAQCTLVLAVLRGALLDLLATGDVARTTEAVLSLLRQLPDRAE